MHETSNKKRLLFTLIDDLHHKTIGKKLSFMAIVFLYALPINLVEKVIAFDNK